LIYLGIRAFLERGDIDDANAPTPPVPLGKVFRQGFVVNLLNPKTAVFFLAFVPQFIDPARGTTPQILVLGALFVILGTLSDGLYAAVAGSLGNRLQQRRWWQVSRRAVSGTVYLGLGVLAATGGIEPEST
jgi:threonine/homoserine/homoserine lactone efflux protein